MPTLHPLQTTLRGLANPEGAKQTMRFFKTGPGEYGEGDVFLGITVPNTRLVLKKYLKEVKDGIGSQSDLGVSITTTGIKSQSTSRLSFPKNDTKETLIDHVTELANPLLSKLTSDAEILLTSPYHEERLMGVYILVEAMKLSKKNVGKIREIGEIYFKHRAQINNWDLVDTSSPQVIGKYRSILSNEEEQVFIEQCLSSNHLWTERILVLSYFADIKNGDAIGFLKLAPKFFEHPHDLIHKAVGWMLREIGKRVSKEVLREYMTLHSKEMPRTMLRYAIEHFDEVERSGFMG